MADVEVHPDSDDDPTCTTWTWSCGCGRFATGHRTSRVALADAEDHDCPEDPLTAGQEALF